LSIPQIAGSQDTAKIKETRKRKKTREEQANKEGLGEEKNLLGSIPSVIPEPNASLDHRPE